MKLVRYGQAALIAAIMTLTANAVWAQQPCPPKDACIYNRIYEVLSGIPCEIKVKCCVSKDCCASGGCCKDGQCCKAEDCCSNSKKCDAKCSCCKDSKCLCCKDGECGCDKKGKCSCDKDKTTAANPGCDGCPFLGNLAKRTAIIMVMPASMPLPACCMEAMGMLPHPPMPPMPPMPPGPHVFLPPMMPPMPPIPPTPSMGIGCPIAMPPMPAYNNYSYGYAPCPDGSSVWAAGQPTVVPCSTTPTDIAKVCIIGASSSDHDQLAMSIGEETSIRCKKMTIKIGENEIRVSRFDDRVRVRGEDLKATADCIQSDRRERLILEGDVVLHYKKDGHSAHVTGERIELNLSNGAITVKRAAKAPTIGITPVIHESK